MHVGKLVFAQLNIRRVRATLAPPLLSSPELQDEDIQMGTVRLEWQHTDDKNSVRINFPDQGYTAADPTRIARTRRYQSATTSSPGDRP